MPNPEDTLLSLQKPSICTDPDPNEKFIPNYGNRVLTFSHGQGLKLYDLQGNEFLDFGSGIAVSVLGHGDEKLANVIAEQAKKLLHVSNLYHSLPSIKLSQQLTTLSGLGRVFFSNSGTEANEAGIKFILKRRYSLEKAGNPLPFAPRIICFEGGFHGRTLGSLSASSSPKYRNAFEPLLPYFTFIPFGDLRALRESTSIPADAIISEPIQGEGGVRCAPDGFFRELSDLAKSKDMIFMMDEVQCSLGRLGTLFAFERFGVKPDIVSLAKPLAGGLPIGATIVSEEIARVVEPGDHGSTFGANPVSCAAACHILSRLEEEKIPHQVRKTEEFFHTILQALLRDFPGILTDLRGLGFLCALDTVPSSKDVVAYAQKQGLLVLTAGTNTVRIAPPLIATKRDFIEFDKKMRATLSHFI